MASQVMMNREPFASGAGVRRRSLVSSLQIGPVRVSLNAERGGTAATARVLAGSFLTKRCGLSVLLAGLLLAQVHFVPVSVAQRAQPARSGAHSNASRENFTAADRRLVERAIGATCAERIRDPQGSMPIDEMQTRPSLPVTDAEALAGARRAERLLPVTKKLVAEAIIQLAKEYEVYGAGVVRANASVSRRQRKGPEPAGTSPRRAITSAIARVQAVRRVKPDVDARDNASVVLREPRTIEFGTIFLAGLRSDEAMISVLAHELTHIASGQADSLRPLFRAVGRRAATRTGLHIQGQRAEELACDLVGVIAAHKFIGQNASWEPPTRRLARALEHNCVDDDASDEDHLSPRSTIRALFALELDFANEIIGESEGSLTR